jgi:hypothetical protein
MNRPGYPDGCTQAMHDRVMAETDGNENAVEAVLEGWARDEAEGVRLGDWFASWLHEYQPSEATRLIDACVRAFTVHGTRRDGSSVIVAVDPADQSQAIDRARDALIAAYIAYRVGTFDDYDRGEAERQMEVDA